MDWKLFAQLAATFFATALGWWAAHFFSKKRDVENDRRKLRTEYLLEVYRRLQNAAHRVGMEGEYDRDIESAITDIQLLGTPHQAKLASQIALDMERTKHANIDDLLTDLRDLLRSELNLEPLHERSRILRFYDQTKGSPLAKPK